MVRIRSIHKFSINPERFRWESIHNSHPPRAGSPTSPRMVGKRAGKWPCLISLRRRRLKTGGGPKVVLVINFFWHDKKSWFWQFSSSKTKETRSWFKRNYIRWTRYIYIYIYMGTGLKMKSTGGRPVWNFNFGFHFSCRNLWDTFQVREILRLWS